MSEGLSWSQSKQFAPTRLFLREVAARCDRGPRRPPAAQPQGRGETKDGWELKIDRTQHARDPPRWPPARERGAQREGGRGARAGTPMQAPVGEGPGVCSSHLRGSQHLAPRGESPSAVDPSSFGYKGNVFPASGSEGQSLLDPADDRSRGGLHPNTDMSPRRCLHVQAVTQNK